MRSASCYTDLRRTVAYAKNRKVQYPGSVAKNWETLQAALPCNPDFTIQNYVGNPIYCGQTNACAILQPVQPVSDLRFVAQDPADYPTDPGSGNFTLIEISYPDFELNISDINSNGQNVSTELSNIPNGSTLTITSIFDPLTTFQATLNFKLDKGTFWLFTITALTPPPPSIFSITFTISYV